MPKALTDISGVTLHLSDAGITVVSVWFASATGHREKVTFSTYDLFDYPLFCARVLEVTGHLYFNADIEETSDPWTAQMRWRGQIRAYLNDADVQAQVGSHWTALVE